MKKSWFFGAAIVLATFALSSLPASVNVRNLDTNNNGIYEAGEVNECQEYVSGKAQCSYPVTCFKKCNYCTKRCVCEPYTVQKKCCRYVDKHYTKTHCRYIPEYYTKTYTCKVPEYYCVDETKYRKRYVQDEHCYYKPYTYCKSTSCDIDPCTQKCMDCK